MVQASGRWRFVVSKAWRGDFPKAAAWRLRSRHYGVKFEPAGFGKPNPPDWREQIVTAKRRSEARDHSIIRRSRIKQRRLDRYLSDPESEEWLHG